jgi:hypothetical protein
VRTDHGRDVIGLGNAEPDAIGPQPGVTGEVPLKVGERASSGAAPNKKSRLLFLQTLCGRAASLRDTASATGDEV